MNFSPLIVVCTAAVIAAACSDAASTAKPVAAAEPVVYRSDIKPVTRVADAKPGVFIPPFLDCRPPVAGERAAGPDGNVCTNVSIAGATEPGKAFSRYAACEVVLTQRPYYPAPPAKVSSATDPRASDTAFMGELAWAKAELAASGCACCHDATLAPRGASQWDIQAKPIWLDTVSDAGLALFAGFADSSVLGAYAAGDNHGFDRTETGVPTTDTARMKRLVAAELARRGISESQARTVPPFGGPIYANSVRKPEMCGAGEGIDPEGKVLFKGASARYVYVLEPGSRNPGVPPNLDHPEGTRWRLDVLPNAEALASGLRYGKTPKGSYQDTPVRSPALALENGKTYQLAVLKDVGVPLANCLFVFGSAIAPISEDAGVAKPDAAGDGGAPSSGFGAVCTMDATCVAPTTYCAKRPGSDTGYCTVTGCKENASICPTGWSCFDLSKFQEGAPSICSQP
jgi:hypothetical protein